MASEFLEEPLRRLQRRRRLLPRILVCCWNRAPGGMKRRANDAYLGFL